MKFLIFYNFERHFVYVAISKSKNFEFFKLHDLRKFENIIFYNSKLLEKCAILNIRGKLGKLQKKISIPKYAVICTQYKFVNYIFNLKMLAPTLRNFTVNALILR